MSLWKWYMTRPKWVYNLLLVIGFIMLILGILSEVNK